jgi:DNA-binding PadR family transcriptional regulator
MIHAFDDEVAVVVGVKGAILLNHIAWWVRKNEASGINFHDGYYWTYNTSDAYSKIFPFFSADVIRKELKNLEKAGYILAGCYNKSAMNRTKWYTLTDEGRKLTKCNRIDDRIEADDCPNPSGQNQETSIDSNKHSSNKHSNKSEAVEISPALAEAWKDFEEHRRKLRKPMTDKAKALILSKLMEYGKTDEEKIAILNQSIERGWQGVFPIGGDRRDSNGGFEHHSGTGAGKGKGKAVDPSIDDLPGWEGVEEQLG